MAAGLSAAVTPKPLRFFQSTCALSKPTSTSLLPPSNLRLRRSTIYRARRKILFSVCVVLEDHTQRTQMDNSTEKFPDYSLDSQISTQRLAEKLSRKKSERFTYLVAAVMSSFGITSMAVLAVYYRFYWQLEVLYVFFFMEYLFVLSRRLKSEKCVYLFGYRVQRYLC